MRAHVAGISERFCRHRQIQTAFWGKKFALPSSYLLLQPMHRRNSPDCLQVCVETALFHLWHHSFPPLFLPTCSWRHQNCGCRRSGTEGQPWSRASWSFPCALGSTRVVNLGRAMGGMLNMSARRAGSAVIRHNEAGLL